MTTIRCIDFETTGLPPGAGVVEAGWTDVIADGDEVLMSDTASRLCNPNIMIGEAAEKVHGISDEMIKNAPPVTTVFIEMGEGADVFCAHNAEFEQNFFGGGDRPWICTYKVALALYPDLPSHRNGELPAHLGIDLDLDRCVPLHRAGPDTYVTAMILRHFLAAGHTVDQMVDISRKPKLITRMPMGKGKHPGCRIRDLPQDYLQWGAENYPIAEFRRAMARELKARAVS